MIFNEKTFKSFWTNSLDPITKEIKAKYSVVEVFEELKPELAKSEYLNEVASLLNNSGGLLNEKLSKQSGNGKIDEHKIAGLLLVVLLKRPIFFIDYNKKNTTVGFYFASILFAWRAALSLLKDLIMNMPNIPKDYEKYLDSEGLAMPSDNYEKETWRTLELCFRDFHRDSILYSRTEPAPFKDLAPKSLAGDGDWGWALIFANLLFLIEKNSFAIFELYKAWSNGSSLA